jgi:pyruvate formate lyase activating enzyme
MQIYISDLKGIDSGNEYLKLFFTGCNFNCPFCNTPNMLIAKEEFLVDMKNLKRRIVDGEEQVVLFSGGEPTMQRQAIIQLMKFAKDLGKKTILHTNGSKPDTIKILIEQNLADYIFLDIKAPLEKEILEKVTKSSTFFKPIESVILDIKETIDLIKENSIKTKVLITIVPGLIFKKEDILKIAKIANDLDASLTLNQFENTVCHDTRYMAIKPASLEFLNNLKLLINKEFPEMNVEINVSV